MIINPHTLTATQFHPDSRQLLLTLPAEGEVFKDPRNKRRTWRVLSFFQPAHRYGLRARLVDNKHVVGWCNQRDLELLLGQADAGERCPWLGEDYVGPQNPGWVGIGMEPVDWQDELRLREIDMLTQGCEIAPWTELETLCEWASRPCFARYLYNGGPFDGPDVTLRWLPYEKEMIEWNSLP
jgi:hypothetical protein